MSCKDCDARREMMAEALFQGRLAAAIGHAVKGAAEMVGIKEKTGLAEQEDKKTARRSRKAD